MDSKILSMLVLLAAFFQTQLLSAQARKGPDRSQEIKVGDGFVSPQEVSIMRYPKEQPNWKDLESKLVILDFFATNCGTCIQSMPKLQGIKDRMGDKVEIFNVTRESKDVLDKFFARNTFLIENKVHLPVIYDDSYLTARFPHTFEPHVVWIYKGKVQAVTFSDFVKEENIQKLFDTGTIDLPLKDDFGTAKVAGSGMVQFKTGAWMTGYQEGVPPQASEITVDSLTGQVKSSLYNMPIFVALLSTWGLIQAPEFYTKPNRVVWKVRDSTLYDYFTPGVGYEVFRSRYGICYERFDEVKRSESEQAKVMLEDLHNFLGIRSYYSKKKMDCVVLRTCPIKPAKAGTANVKKQGFEGTGPLTFFLDYSNKFPPIVDLVKSKELLHLIGTSFANLDELNEQLGPYGIEAVEDHKEVDVFVIEEMQ